jgi:nucleoside-diphosphate-sugar epimerase
MVADLLSKLRGRPSILSSQKVIEMRQSAWVASPAKAARVLGWTARTPLVEGLARTARWYADHGWL